ncbi:MAG: hypothetical protein ACR2PH_09795 [Desulfobulbia bacterium]
MVSLPTLTSFFYVKLTNFSTPSLITVQKSFNSSQKIVSLNKWLELALGIPISRRAFDRSTQPRLYGIDKSISLTERAVHVHSATGRLQAAGRRQNLSVLVK